MACGPSIAPGVSVRLANHGAPVQVAALFAAAVDVQTAGATAWEVHDRTRDLLVEASWRHGLVPIGPWDVAMLSGAQPDAPVYQVSTLGDVVDAASLSRDRVLVLQSDVTVRVATVAGGRGSRTTVQGADGEVEASLALRDASTGALIASADVRRAIDPLGALASPDPAPWTTRALVDGLRAILATAQDAGAIRLPAVPAPVPGLRLVGDPRAADDFRAGKGPTFAQHVARLDELDRELARLARAERLDPGDPAGLVEALEGRPPGLLVLEAPPGWPLRAGDLIVEAGGRRTARLPDWAAAILLARPDEPITLRVDRGGAPLDIDVTPPRPSAEPAD